MFTVDFIQAVNDWQRGGSAKQKEKRGRRIKELAGSLLEEFREVALVCFRQVALEKEFVWVLGDELGLTESISSWTTDLEIAKTFKGGVPPAGYQGVIFEVVPDASQVILNLAALYRSSDFQEAVKTAAPKIIGFGDGIGRYGDSQSEVILEVDQVPLSSVYALGGYSSERDQIARVFFQREPTEADLRWFDDLLERSRRQLGPHWLTGDGLGRVVAHLPELVKRLRPWHPK